MGECPKKVNLFPIFHSRQINYLSLSDISDISAVLQCGIVSTISAVTGDELVTIHKLATKL